MGDLSSLGKLLLTGKILLKEDLIRVDPEAYENDEGAAKEEAKRIWNFGLSRREKDK